MFDIKVNIDKSNSCTWTKGFQNLLAVQVPDLLNTLNDNLPDDLLFDGDASSSGGPSTNGPVGSGGTGTGSGVGNQAISTSTIVSGTMNVVNAQVGSVPSMRPTLANNGVVQTSVVTNGIMSNDVGKTIITSQPNMIVQGPGGQRMRAPGPINSNPNISLVNALKGSPVGGPRPTGPQVSNGPIMVTGIPPGSEMKTTTMNNGNTQMMANNNGPPNMGNIIGGRIMQNQQPMLPNGPRMVRTPNMIPRFGGGMVTQNPGGHPLRPQTMQVRMTAPGGQVINSGLPPGSVAMVSHSGQFVSSAVAVNTSAPMQMAPNGIRPMQPGPGMQQVVAGTSVNLPPQYPSNQNQLESSGKGHLHYFLPLQYYWKNR